MEQIYASIVNTYITNMTVGHDASVPLSVSVNGITTHDRTLPITMGNYYDNIANLFYTVKPT